MRFLFFSLLLIFLCSCSSLVLLNSSKILPPKENEFFTSFFIGFDKTEFWDENPPYCPSPYCTADWELSNGGLLLGWRRGLSKHLESTLKLIYSYPFVVGIATEMKVGDGRYFALGIGMEAGYPIFDMYVFPILTLTPPPLELYLSPRAVFYPLDPSEPLFLGFNAGFLIVRHLALEFFGYNLSFLDDCPGSECYTDGPINVLGMGIGFIF